MSTPSKNLESSFSNLSIQLNNTSEQKIQLNETSWITISKLPEELQLKDFESLYKLIPTEQATVTIYGKQHKVPRFLKTYGHGYKFSNEEHKAEELTDPFLIKLLEYTNKAENYKFKYNGELVNWYRDGNDYIGEHSDNEKDLVQGAPIYSFSFGATRDFIIKSKKDDQKIVLPLEDNTLLIMGGETQKYYKHSVPKRLKCKKARINVTIRAFKE